jgi:peptide/nickel transport system permease protein
MNAGPRRRRSRWPWLCAGLLLLAALLAPLLANDVPLVARVGGRWSFPAVADMFGSPPRAPGDQTWKQWWARLPEDSEDFALPTPWPYGPEETDLDLLCAGPSFAHPFGNDDTGRDVLARIVCGAQPSLGTSALGVLLAALVGTALGALAGHRRGIADLLVLRLIELFLCFPALLLLLAVAAFFGSSALGVIAVFGLVMWPSFARIVRGELLALRERDFVLAARGLGVGETRILLRHLLPQVRGQIAVTAAFCLASAVVAESTLSFLGIGPGVQAGSWGRILAQGKDNAHLGVWHLWFFPAAAIVGTATCCHVLADRLRPGPGPQ